MLLDVGTTIMYVGRMCSRYKKSNKKKKQTKRTLNAPKFLALVVSVGKVKGHYQIFATTSLAHTLAGVSVLRLELVAMEIVKAEDVQIHLGNVKLVLPSWDVHRENGKNLIFKTQANSTHKPIWMRKESPYEREH